MFQATATMDGHFMYGKTGQEVFGLEVGKW